MLFFKFNKLNFKAINNVDNNKMKDIKVFINGDWIGYTKNPKCIVECFKEARSLGKINIHSSIYWEHNTQTINILP